MSIATHRTPSYRLHKPSGQAVTTIGGRDHYLGRHGSAESRAEYDRLIAEWLVHGRSKVAPTSSSGSDVTVNEMLLDYLRHADAYYVKDGKPTAEPANIRLALRPLRQLYGHCLARDFGPLALKAVRHAMIGSGLCRTEVNKRVGKVARVFKWAVENEIVPPSVHHGLRAVAGLRKGRADVRESKPVRSAPEAFVEAVRPNVARQVWAMIELQRLTGMRPGEVVSMRTRDIEATGRTWTYTPSSHKTEHHGRDRTIYLGPRARAILKPWLRPELEAFLFSPAEATAERQAEKRRTRKSPVQPSQRDRSKARPKKHAGDAYTVDSYRRAIAYGCKRADVPKWHPHQLRHNAATWLRKEFGLDAARAVLGHSSPAVTEIYAELDSLKAADVMERVG